MTAQEYNFRIQRGNPRRLMRLAAGYVFFAIGFVGMFLPLLPTTIFWIIAAVCFAKGSPAMYRRIVTWPQIGKVIGEFTTHGIIRPVSKRIALGGMAASVLLMMLLRVDHFVVAATIPLLFCAAGYVMTRPTEAAEAAIGSVIAKQE